MAYFDTKKRSLVVVDGSPCGISAILAQKEHHSQQCKILSYASRALSPVETRYSQTDIEGLRLVWGIEHFRMFLIGSEFDAITDHKALESIFNNPRSRPPARIDRWMMRLQPFNFKVIYRKGSLNEADY
ncbi:Retrovirus-related Pol poly from transposon, partial [Paramuricea clavata]